MTQLSLLDALHAPPIIRPVDRDGHVVVDPDEALVLPHPRMAWERARIELHRHSDGLWMWSASWQCNNAGRCYGVGAKWGKFAETRDDALFYAVAELRAGLAERDIDRSEASAIMKWAGSLQ